MYKENKMTEPEEGVVITGITGVFDGGIAFQANVKMDVEGVTGLFGAAREDADAFLQLPIAEADGEIVLIDSTKLLFAKMGKYLMLGNKIIKATGNIPNLGRH